MHAINTVAQELRCTFDGPRMQILQLWPKKRKLDEVYTGDLEIVVGGLLSDINDITMSILYLPHHVVPPLFSS